MMQDNHHKGFFDLFFFSVGWMSDGMTDMNGGSPAVWRVASAVTPHNQGNYNKWKVGKQIKGF